LHAMHATLDFCAHGSFIFRQVRPRGFLSRAAIENFFNQVGTHLLRTDNLRIKSFGELIVGE
jgi:nucleoid DNA-binding protein